MSPVSRPRPRVVIVGGGFGGLAVARGLRDTPADVTLVDRKNYHVFQPLLYQVATAGLSPADIARPIRRLLRGQDNARVVMDNVEAIDLERRVVVASSGEIPFDHVVLAAGARHNYFGHPQWERRAPGLKTIEDALEIRRRVLIAFERAESAVDEAERTRELTFVVVGGGPTGVEMAGALREIAVASIPKDFRRVDTTTAVIILVQGADRLLPGMSNAASSRALADLERMGVSVRLGTFVTGVDDNGVWLGDERIATANVIWAAGVRGASVAGTLGVELDAAGRVQVNPDCSVPGHPYAFVVGDLAAQRSADTGDPVPGVAQGALQMGRLVASILHDEICHNVPVSRRPAFVYRDRGNMATIGKNLAVADVGGRFFGGVVAWVLWSTVHVAFLVGFRNKIFVLLSWAWSYLVHARGARLITGRLSPPAAAPSTMEDAARDGEFSAGDHR